jgi:formate C-acetyltransferase
MFAVHAPAPLLSVVINDCIKNGKDYYNGGPRYNTNYIQCCGIGTITDSLSAIKTHVYEKRSVTMAKLLNALKNNFEGDEKLRLYLQNKTPFFGNDDDNADGLMQKVYNSLFETIDGKPNTKMLGATPNGRFAEKPISDGTSPSHGADRNGPTAVIKSLGKMDQVKSGGTLLNQKFLPSVMEKEEDITKLAHLIRSYFKLNGHHIQFNVVDTSMLRKAQAAPDEYRNLLVRVAGYSDYFVDLDIDHQEEIIARTENKAI